MRRFPENVLEALAIGMHVAADLLLGDDAGRRNAVPGVVRIVHVIRILILDRILDGDDVLGMIAAGPVDQRGESGGFPGAGRAGDEAESGTLEDAVAEGVGGVGIDAERLEFGNEVVENPAGDAEPGRAEVGLDPESAGTLAAVTHGDAIAGEVSHAGLGKGGDGLADLFIDAHFHAVFLAEAMAAALAVGDEFLEDGIHMCGAENPEEVEFLHALVGMDIDGPVGAHLNVRDPQLAADAEDDAQQVGAAHAGQETHRRCCRGMTRKWRWFEDGGEDGHGKIQFVAWDVASLSKRRTVLSAASRILQMKSKRSSHSAMRCGESRSQFLDLSQAFASVT